MRIDHYEIEDELARGGQGVVYRAHDSRLGRTVVIKLLAVDGDSGRRRLLREARALAELRHPHLVALHAVGEHAGKPYLVLPFVPGDSLQARLDRGGPLPVPEVLQVAQEVGGALRAAHEAGLVHRDLKPANVLLDAEGRALLTDFGLVKRMGAQEAQTVTLSVCGQFLGTPGFWPPEQAHGKHTEIGPAADVYGFGALLYALLTGDPPRRAGSLLELGHMFDEPLTSVSSQREDVAPWLEELIHRCLTTQPERRPSLPEVLEAVEAQEALPRGTSQRGASLALGLAAALSVSLAVWAATSRPEAQDQAGLPTADAGGDTPGYAAALKPARTWSKDVRQWADLDALKRGSPEHEALLFEWVDEALACDPRPPAEVVVELHERVDSLLNGQAKKGLDGTRGCQALYDLVQLAGPELERRYRQVLPELNEDRATKAFPAVNTLFSGQPGDLFLLLGQNYRRRGGSDSIEAAACFVRAIEEGNADGFAELSMVGRTPEGGAGAWTAAERRVLSHHLLWRGLEAGSTHCRASLAFHYIVRANEFACEFQRAGSLVQRSALGRLAQANAYIRLRSAIALGAVALERPDVLDVSREEVCAFLRRALKGVGNDLSGGGKTDLRATTAEFLARLEEGQ